MDREIIEDYTATLPESKLGAVIKDHEKWDEVDGGARFRVTRHGTSKGGPDIIIMNIAGQPSERARVISEFSEVFGEPISQRILPDKIDNIDSVLWHDKRF